MILCVCSGVTDRDIQRHIDAGHRCMSALQRCGVGNDCGSCHDTLRGLLRKAGASDSALRCHATAGDRQPAIA